MKNLYIILITVLMFSSVFARASVKHSSNVQPEGLSFSSKKAEFQQGFDSSDDDLRWKRRHKKRKKMRRPQRGR
tara:strand:+ start:91 stop:312 length:222 start_codon:yes stop_codon:yes gene_type:complete